MAIVILECKIKCPFKVKYTSFSLISLLYCLPFLNPFPLSLRHKLSLSPVLSFFFSISSYLHHFRSLPPDEPLRRTDRLYRCVHPSPLYPCPHRVVNPVFLLRNPAPVLQGSDPVFLRSRIQILYFRGVGSGYFDISILSSHSQAGSGPVILNSDSVRSYSSRIRSGNSQPGSTTVPVHVPFLFLLLLSILSLLSIIPKFNLTFDGLFFHSIHVLFTCENNRKVFFLHGTI